MSTAEMALRLVVAVLLGGTLGINRFAHRRYVGLRTLSIVSLAGAALTIVSGQHLTPDGTSRVMQGLLTGVGFIGAGVIIHGRHASEVKGLTSAATVLLCVATGITSGLADWSLLLVLAVLALSILTLGGPIERSLIRRFGLDRDEGSDDDQTKRND